MIVSASRRTDIPAFYLPWMLERLRQGYALARNPHNPRQISRVVLSPEETDCLVFWTKDGSELLAHLDELESFGIPFYVQWTLNGYGTDLEPGVPEKQRLLESFRELGRRLGPRRLVWRYDPVLVYGPYTADWHLQTFDRFCCLFSGITDTCIFSFVDLYAKTRRAIPKLQAVSAEGRERLASGFARSAAAAGIALRTCCEEGNFGRFGIGQAACIDRARIEDLAGHAFPAVRDSGQRPHCGCIRSVDIGAYGTCAHGCAYCYAAGRGNPLSAHRPDSPLLSGELGPGDRVPPGPGRQLTLFDRTDPGR